MGILAILRGRRPEDKLRAVLGDYQLPSFPKVLMEARALVRNPDSSIDEIGERIAQDPGATAHILKILNSAAFGLRNPVDSVEQAVALLGRAQIETILLAHGVGSALPKPRGAGYDANTFWQAAARRAAVSRALAEQLHPASASAAFTASLLEDMAIPVLVQVLEDPYRELLRTREDGTEDLRELERERFGWDHAQIGGWMCEAWEFPAMLTASIAGHHGADQRGAKASPAVRAAALLPDAPVANGIEDFICHLRDVHGFTPQRATEIVADAEDSASETAKLFV